MVNLTCFFLESKTLYFLFIRSLSEWRVFDFCWIFLDLQMYLMNMEIPVQLHYQFPSEAMDHDQEIRLWSIIHKRQVDNDCYIYVSIHMYICTCSLSVNRFPWDVVNSKSLLKFRKVTGTTGNSMHVKLLLYLGLHASLFQLFGLCQARRKTGIILFLCHR